jgi:lysozyme family protein
VSAAFDRGYRFTMLEEAGPVAGPKLVDQGLSGDRHALVDNKKDRGGRTAYGITQGTFDQWCDDQGAAHRDVWTITANEIRAIASGRYWDYLPQYCPPRLAVAVFDTAFLHGKVYAARRLQTALGIPADGQVGPVTLEALKRCCPDDVVGACTTREGAVLQTFLQARDDQYEAIVAHDGSQVEFYRGWEDRLDRLEKLLGVPRTTDPR